MAIPNSTTVGNLTRCKTYPGFFPGGYCDQFIRKIPFEAVDSYGPTLNINRATLGATTSYAPGGAPSGSASSSATASFTFQRIGGTAEIDTADRDSSPEAQRVLVQMKRVSLIRQLASQVIVGDGTASQLSGIRVLTDAAQAIVPVGGAGTAPVLDDYHRVLSMVCASDGTTGAGADALVVHPRTRRQILALLDAAGGPTFHMDEALGVSVLHLGGVPVYLSQNMLVTEDVTGAPTGGVLTSAYAVKLTGPTGIRVLHQGGDPSDYGLVSDDVPVQLATAVEGATVRGYYALLLPELGSIARLYGIDITAFA